jgi:hypothetical protein
MDEVEREPQHQHIREMPLAQNVVRKSLRIEVSLSDSVKRYAVSVISYFFHSQKGTYKDDNDTRREILGTTQES